MTDIQREKSASTRRRNARTRAMSMYDAFSDARLELGANPPLAKLAYYITGLKIMSSTGKRWSSQTISNVVFIDAVQRKSTDEARDRIFPHYSFDPVEQERWKSSLDAEVAEAEVIGKEIRQRLGMFSG